MKSPGQIAYEAWYDPTPVRDWGEQDILIKERWEKVATAVLEGQWRSVDDPPENTDERVVIAGGGDYCHIMPFYSKGNFRTFWMRVPQLPKPKELTPLELAKRDFIDFFEKKGGYNLKINIASDEFYFDSTQCLWEGWKSAKGVG